jgi:hypothetical protein
MIELVMDDEHEVALEAETGSDDHLGDGTKSKGAGWVDPDTQP